MEIIIDEGDFRGVFSKKEKTIIENKEERSLLGNSDEKKIGLLIRKIPTVIAKIINNMNPPGFGVSEFEISFEISGNPFNIGVSGAGKIVFKKTIDKD